MTEYQILAKRLGLAVDHALNALSEYVEQEETRNNLKTILEEFKKQLNKFEKMLHDKNNPAIAKLISSQCTLLQNAAESLFVNIDLSKDNEFEKKLIEILGEEIRAVFKLPATLSLEDLRDEAKALLFDSTLEDLKSTLQQHAIQGPSCFISYAWDDAAIAHKVHKMAQQLLSAGVNVVLDIWHNRTNSIIEFTQRVYQEDFVLVMGSSLLKQKYESPGQYGSYVREELQHIGIRIKERQDKQKFPFGNGVLKVLVENPYASAFPDFLKPYPFYETDFTNEHHYYDKFFNLLDHVFVKSSEAKKILSHTKVQFKQDSEGLRELTEEELKRYLIQDATDEQKAEQLKSIRKKLQKALRNKQVLANVGYQTQPVFNVHCLQNSNTNRPQAANYNTNEWTEYSASNMQIYQSSLIKEVGTSSSSLQTNRLNEEDTVSTKEQSTCGVKRKVEFLFEAELTPANKRQKTKANDAMSCSEPFGPSNTEEVITKVKALLCQHYHEPAYAELKRLLHERTFPINKSFINLAIVKEYEQKPKDEQLKGIKILSRDEYINSFETIYQPKAPIKIEELLLARDDENKELKRQLIEGRAGIGKTTLCQYLSHQWAAGDNKWDIWRQQFDWVIHLPLRQLTVDEHHDFSEHKLARWLYTQHVTLLKQQHINEIELADALHVLNGQGKVLLLLDGYDEIVPILNSNSSFQQFFEQQLLSCTYWLVFSRPYYFTDNRVERRLENIGFTTKTILRYVQQYFGDVEKEIGTSQRIYAYSLMAYLKQDPNAMGIAHIPINLELLCYVWKNRKDLLDNQLTLTQLYDHLVLSLFGRYLNKYYPKDISSASGITWEDIQEDKEYYGQQILAFLEQLAWQQMQQSGLIISAEVIKKLVSNSYPGLKYKSQREAFGEVVLKQLGLLKGCDVHKPTLEQSYYFIHLTFQEYFAARYWAKLFQDQKKQVEAIKFLQSNKFNPRYEIVWWMVAGLLKDDREPLESFFDYLQQAPRDLAGLNQQLLQIRCLEECQLSISESRKNKLLVELIQWISYEIVAGEKYKFDFIATYLEISPRLCKQEPYKQLLEAVFNSNNSVSNILKTLKNQKNLPISLHQHMVKLLIDQDDWYKRLTGTVVLGNQISLSEDILLQFATLLKDEDFLVRNATIWALSSQTPLPEKVYQKLVELLIKEDNDIRLSVIKVLQEQINLPESVLRQLVEIINREKWEVKYIAAKILGKQNYLPDNIYLQLLALLNSKDGDVRLGAIQVCAEQTSLPENILQQLIELLKDKKARAASARALRKQTALPNYILQQLIELLEEKMTIIRHEAASLLGKQKKLSEFFLQQLVVLLGNKDRKLRFFPAHVLSELVYLPENILKPIANLLNNENSEIRSIASQALVSQTSLSKDILEKLEALLSDKKWAVRSGAVLVLGNQTSLSNTILQRIVALLSDDEWDVKLDVLNVLAKRTTLPESVCQKLLTFLNSKNSDISDEDSDISDEDNDISNEDSDISDEDNDISDEDNDTSDEDNDISDEDNDISDEDSDISDEDSDISDEDSHISDEDSHISDEDNDISNEDSDLSDEDNDLSNKNDQPGSSAAAKVLSNQIHLSENILQELVKLLETKSRQVQNNATKVLIKQISLPEDMTKKLVELLKANSSQVQNNAAKILIKQISLSEDIIQKLVELLKANSSQIQNNAANILHVQKFMPKIIFSTLGILATTDAALIASSIAGLSISLLIKFIKEKIVSENLIPLLRLLFIKSHQQKLPIYFVDSEQASGKLFLDDRQSELHIGHKWQVTFTYQQKQIFIKEFNYVFLEMTGMLPELSFTELRAFKNQLAGQLLNQARVLFQLANKTFPLNCMADKKIVSRILFFTPASQVLDDSQQEKIINYAEDKNALRIPFNKVMFWQRIGISDNQNTVNIIDTPSLEELKFANQPKVLEIKK